MRFFRQTLPGVFCLLFLPFFLSAEQEYTVQKGDSFYTIAKKNHTTVEALRRLNDCFSNRLQPGEKLLVPGTGVSTTVVKAAVKKSKPVLSATTGAVKPVSYTVRKGDSLYTIARKNNTTVDELKRLNDLSHNRLQPGDTLALKPTPRTSKPVAVAMAKKTMSPSPAVKPAPAKTDEEMDEPSAVRAEYIVRKGDSLYTIARKNNTTVDELKRLNSLSQNRLQPGDKILVSGMETEDLNITNTDNVLRTHKVYHRIRKGEVLSTIAKKYDLSVDDLKDMNGLKGGKLTVGKRLLVRIEEVTTPLPEMPQVTAEKEEEEGIDLVKSFSENNIPGKMLDTACSFLNSPYRWGGNSYAGIDCSGLVKKSFSSVGITLPRTSREQARLGDPVSLSDLLPGDLIFFKRKNRGSISHVAIYVGDGKMIHATRKGGKVVLDSVENPFLTSRYVMTARRLLPNAEETADLDNNS